jgi:hypothetical protein
MSFSQQLILLVLACSVLAGASCDASPERQNAPAENRSAASAEKPTIQVARRLGPAPRSCPGPHQRPENVARAYAPLVGKAPFWAGFYARYDSELHLFTATDAPRTRQGFRVKVLWVMAPEYENRVKISGENLATDAPIRFHFEDMEHTTEPELTPDIAGLGDGGWRELPSYAYFDRAGCFRIKVSSDQGTWRFGFGFGRH